MPYTIKSKLQAQEVRDRYREWSDQHFLPLSCQVFVGAMAYPTKDGMFLIKHDTQEVFTNEESIEGKRHMRLMKLKKIYENNYLICKKTFYESDFYKNENEIDSFQDKISKKFKKPQWIKNKKYKIYKLDEYTNEFGNFMRCYLLECEVFFQGRKREEVFIYQDSVEKIFYSENELRKIKLQEINAVPSEKKN